MTRTDGEGVFGGLDLVHRYAPVRRLADGALVAAELQITGRPGTAVSTPESLRRTARLMQESVVVDQRKLAIAGENTTVADFPVLITVDIGSIDHAAAPPGYRQLASVDPDDFLRHPNDMLAEVERTRNAGHLICVDLLGITNRAMTLLWLIDPDVIIMTAELLARDDAATAQLAHGLTAHVERSGALVIAEGVDTEARRIAAQTIGADYGIGKLFPPVAELAALGTEPSDPLPLQQSRRHPSEAATTPYSIASAEHRPRRGDKRLLIEMSKALEVQASTAGPGVLVLGTFQEAKQFTPLTAKRWRVLADRAGFAGVYGVGLSHMLDGNVQHAPLDPTDDLVNEWTVVVLGPHSAALLAARDRDDHVPDLDRTFDVVQSYDRDLATRAAHSILTRFTIPSSD
ncbi:DICT sensory domain-containing protein [Williamsia soli]|uniref:DICT sensory domain-containing protein n=1 Tax=Williamsia soli TaxID=364929 RepID=UPI001A9E40CA|nr:DICT sensory domain-containing protein [Williamsia soli]